MATVNMTAIQFYNPFTTAPSPSARYAATLQKYRQSTGVPHRKEWSRVLKSHSQSLNTGKDIAGKQDNASDSSITADEDDEFLPVDEVIRRALHLEDSTEKPTNSMLAAQGTDEPSFLDGSSYSMLAQSSLPGHLDGSKEQPVILDDNDDDDDSNSTSGGGISSDLNANGTGRELGPPPSSTTPYPGSRPSSSRDPSPHPSAAPHDQPPEDHAIQQDDGYISREMLEQPSYPALIVLVDEDNEAEMGQQQQEGREDRERGAHNSDTSSNANVDDDDDLQHNDENKGLQPTKQRRPSPSYDSAIRRSRKRRLQNVDEGVSTIWPTQQQHHREIAKEKEQKGHDCDGIGSCSGSDNDHRDDQDSDDSEDPRPAKRHRLLPSSNDPSPSVSNNSGSEDSGAGQPIKRRRPSPSNSDPTSKRSRRQRLQRHSERCSNTAPPQTQLDLSVNSDDCAQSQHSSTHTSKDDEQMPTTAEYQEWPMHGFFKRTTIGNKTRYSIDFSLEQLREICAVACPLHATPPTSDRYFSAGKANLPKVCTRVKKTRSAALSRSKRIPFTSKENATLLDLKENKGWPWKRIESKFPQRTLNSLQVHYCTKLKGKVLTEGDESE